MTGYLCKYSPTALIEAFGGSCRRLNTEQGDLAEAERIIHPNTCSRAKAFLQEGMPLIELLLTNCCDSIRRAGDILNDGTRFVGSVDLPHEDGECAIDRYAKELIRFAEEYGRYRGTAFDRGAFLAAWKRPAAEIPQGPWIALLGASASDGLKERLGRMLPLPLVDLTCSGAAEIEDPPEDAEEMPFEDLMRAYAAALLRQMPCMRMKAVGRRRQLTEHPGMAGVIYHTVRFCDYYSFEYGQLNRELSVPLLKLESDYTPQTAGQLATRAEAFCETLKAAGGEKMTGKIRPEGRYFLGIDIGSTSTDAVAVDRDGNIVEKVMIRTGPRAGAAAEAARAELCRRLSESPDCFILTAATGYGRSKAGYADFTKTEIACHARGAARLNKGAGTVIDIGGQDSKVIVLGPSGEVTGFVMNDKCAAGTGRFLEMMARTLEMELPEMAEAGLSWKEDLTISSTCTVFAESEVVSLIAGDKRTPDIIHGLNKSIAAKTASMVKRAGGHGPYVMSGGVARNKGVAAELEKKLGEPVKVSSVPEYCGAYGAALFAREAAEHAAKERGKNP